MKKISKLISFVALSMLAVTSCDMFTIGEPYDNYVPVDKPAVAEVYFAKDLPSYYDLADKSSFSVKVNRVNKESAVTVPLYAGADLQFAVPSSVSFAAGQDVADIEITFDPAVLEKGTDYAFTLALGEETSVYGNSEYSFKAGLPADWMKWKKGIISEVFMDAEEEEYMYYQQVGPTLRYCYIEDCFDDSSMNDLEFDPVDYYFYWDTETNYLKVPAQLLTMDLGDGYPVYFGDPEAFYVDGYGEGFGVGYGYEDDADCVYNGQGETRPYYDENGAFYLADYYYISQADYGEWGYGYAFGGDPDIFIAEGFDRQTHYNDFDYDALWLADVESGMFEEEIADVKMRIFFDPEKPIDDEDEDKAIYYLQNYFGDGAGLAFIAHNPDALDPAADEVVYELDNAQETGMKVFGQEVMAEVKGGKVLFEDGADYPTFQVKVNVYTVDESGKKLTNFGTFEETINPYDEYADWYTVDDIAGLYKEDYLGDLVFFGSDFEEEKEYYWDINISDAGETAAASWLMFDGLLPIKESFMPVNKVKIEWYNGFLYLQEMEMEGPFVYEGASYPASIYPMSTETGKYYNDAYLLGGYYYDEENDMDLLVFVDYPFNEVPVDGYFADAAGFGGLMGYYNLWGYWDYGSSSSAKKVAGSKAWSIRQTRPASTGKYEGRMDFTNVKLSFAASDRMMKKSAAAKTVSRTLNTSNAAPAHTNRAELKSNGEAGLR